MNYTYEAKYHLMTYIKHALINCLLFYFRTGIELLLSIVPSLKRLLASKSDDWIDRLSHIWTVFLLLFFAMFVSIQQFVGDPIQCWCPAEFTGAFESYTRSFCWIKNTYYVPFTNSIPDDLEIKHDAELTYYQWVPLILLFEAFLFKFPNIIWTLFHGYSGLHISKVCRSAEEILWHSPTSRQAAIDNLAFLLDRWRHTYAKYQNTFLSRTKSKAARLCCFFCSKSEGTYLTALYLAVKVFYLFNVIGQFFLLNAFMATDYNVYGFEYIEMWSSGNIMKPSPRFPRVTLCDFKIRQLQNIQRWTVQCTLPINLFNEKIFIFLWFWFFFVACLTAFSLTKWMILVMSKRNNYHFLRKYLDKTKAASDKKLYHRFAESYLRNDGCFILRLIQNNSTDIALMDLLLKMWQNFKKRQ